MQDGVGEGGVGGVAVGLPIGAAGIDLDVSGVMATVDLNGSVGEIRPGAVVPLAELSDAELTSVLEAELAPEGSGVPERLEFKLRRQFWFGNFLEGQGRVPDAF